MNEYIYVRVEVGKADPVRYSTLAGIIEGISGSPAPDIIPHTDPGAIKIQHVRVMAESSEHAYNIGSTLLPDIKKGYVDKDYVIRV